MTIDSSSQLSLYDTNPRSNSILLSVIKENRKALQDNLKDILGLTDFIFERQHNSNLSRSDYYEIDSIGIDKGERCNKFLDILSAKGDDKTLDLVIKYLEGTAGAGAGGGGGSHSVLREKLKLSRDKWIKTKTETEQKEKESALANTPLSPSDSADFTLTHKSLETICHQFIIKHKKAKKLWSNVVSNMNGLEDLELLAEEVTTTDYDGEEEIKMQLRHRAMDIGEGAAAKISLFDEQHDNIWNVQPYIYLTNWEEIAIQSCTLWKDRNGMNATFFSFVGIFQHSQLMEVADWLLNSKDEIQKGNFR